MDGAGVNLSTVFEEELSRRGIPVRGGVYAALQSTLRRWRRHLARQGGRPGCKVPDQRPAIPNLKELIVTARGTNQVWYLTTPSVCGFVVMGSINAEEVRFSMSRVEESRR